MIEVEKLHLRYGDFDAVKGVSFTVEKGAAFGVVGESGSGKSSVLRVLAGLAVPTGGAVRIGGEAITTKRSIALSRQLQMVFQDPYGSLHPRHTVDDTLSEPLQVHGFGDVEQRVKRALEEVGLPTTARFRYPHQLSGGQRQRVAIARALIIDPEVVLLDEPTSALDVSVQAEVLNLLSDLLVARRLTYVMVGHNLAAVAYICDRIGVMHKGEMVEIVTADALRKGDVSHPHTIALRNLSINIESSADHGDAQAAR